MLSNLREFFKRYLDKILLFLIVFLISLASFAIGYIFSQESQKQNIKFKNIQNYGKKESSYYWRGNMWSLSWGKTCGKKS